MNGSDRRESTRREFLRSAAYGAAAAGLGGVAMTATAAAPAGGKKPALPHGLLGRTKYPVTRVSFGAILISERLGTRVLKAAIDEGVNLVHTSMSYVRGKSLAAVGDLFKTEKAYRDKVFLCLKSYTPEKESEIDDMLKILATDHADVICTEIHTPDPARLEAVQKQQDALKKKGKLRHTGFVCHVDMNGVIEMILAKAPDYFDVALMSMAMAPRPGDKSAAADKTARFVKNLKALHARGVGILSMKSGARKAVQQGAEVFEPHAKALLELGADSVLTSINTLDQVEMVKGLRFKGLPMSPAERASAARFQVGRSAACLMCGDCAKACPAALPVHDLMRFRMYCEEYGWHEHARAEFAALGPRIAAAASACDGCSACADACSVKLAGADAVRRVVSLLA